MKQFIRNDNDRGDRPRQTTLRRACGLLFRQLLAGAFVLSLASCARSTNEGTQEEHRIGAILPLTGGAALYGKWIQEGINVAVTHLEQQHPGHRFRVIYQDDQNQPDRSINALNKLISFNNVPVIIGGVTSTCAAPIAQSKSTVLVSTSASAPELSSVEATSFGFGPPTIGRAASLRTRSLIDSRREISVCCTRTMITGKVLNEFSGRNSASGAWPFWHRRDTH